MKEKRRSNEKRKEKSRDAARCRRSRETDIFTELAAAVPVPESEASHLDKASVMRLAIAYLKTRTLMDSVPKPLAKAETSPEMDELFLKALDGFVMVLDNNGDMAYLSPNVRDHLGIAQMDLMGQNVFDYSHPCDHDEIRESLSIKASDIGEDHPCNFFLRLKCTLTSKGRKVNIKSASYKVIHCVGRLIAHSNNENSSEGDTNDSDSEKKEETSEKEPGISLVVVASPVPHPSNIETPLGKYTFLSKHSLNMKFTYADDKLAEFLGWESNDLVGQSVFDFHHASDNVSLDKSFKSLFHKGQCETLAYRFLNKNGGYAWVVTQATLIHCSRLQKPLSVVCVNYLLSGVEHEDEVYSVRQLEARLASETVSSSSTTTITQEAEVEVELPRKPLADKPVFVTSSLFKQQPKPAAPAKAAVVDGKENDRKLLRKVKVEQEQPAKYPFLGGELLPQPQPPPLAPEPPQQQPVVVYQELPPQAATASIFVPRTKDMNKGFLTFCEDQPGLTMLKDEPEDLTHLAPVAGDVCVPLEDPPFLGEMFDEFLLGSSYCPELLSPELGSSSNSNSHNNNVQPVGDANPLRTSSTSPSSEDCNSSCDAAGDPFIYRDSPVLTKSPDGCDSLGSPNGSAAGGVSDDEILMMSISDVISDDTMNLRAPFIPMSDQDEALQFLISDDMVMWGPNSDKKSKWLTDVEDDNANPSSSLAQLLSNEASLRKAQVDQGAGATIVNPVQVLGQIGFKSTTDDAITADRSNKRSITSSKTDCTANTKRFKQSDFGCSGDPGFSSFSNILSSQKSQLLQQLVSQQPAKSRGWSDQVEPRNRLIGSNAAKSNAGYKDSSLSRLADDGGGLQSLRKTILLEDRGVRPVQQQQQQQSNSVLMNLLVSGCDVQGFENKIEDSINKLATQSVLQSQQKQQQKLRQVQPNNLPQVPIRMQEQLQTVPQWDSNEVFSNNLKLEKKEPLPSITYDPVDYENDFDFMDTGNIFHDGNELLHVFDSNVV